MKTTSKGMLMMVVGLSVAVTVLVVFGQHDRWDNMAADIIGIPLVVGGFFSTISGFVVAMVGLEEDERG